MRPPRLWSTQFVQLPAQARWRASVLARSSSGTCQMDTISALMSACLFREHAHRRPGALRCASRRRSDRAPASSDRKMLMLREPISTRSHGRGELVADVYRGDAGEKRVFFVTFSGPAVGESSTLWNVESAVEGAGAGSRGSAR